MKKEVFKNIIIGSGPSAIGGMLSLRDKNSAVITGFEVNKKKIDLSKIHKKILYENNGNNNYISNIYSNSKKNLFSISKIGGFGNYWGQGCEYVPFDKLNNKKIFINQKSYLNIINKIYDFFCVNKKKDPSFKFSSLFFYPSPILENSPNLKKTKLKSFKYAFNYLSKKNYFKIFNNSVVDLNKQNNLIKIKLNNKKIIYAERVFLAANTVGNASILFNSDRNIQKISFLDDCPNLFYAYSFNKNFNKYIKKFYSIISSNNKSNFISAVSLSNISLSFFSYFFFGIKIKFLKKINFNNFNNFIFLQLWNRKTTHKGYLFRNRTYCNNKPIFNSKNFENLLKKNSIYTLKNRRTDFGEGFHYHNLKIMIKNKWYYLDDYLRKKYTKKIICIDSSVEKKINPGPFTVTQMALALKKVSLFF